MNNVKIDNTYISIWNSTPARYKDFFFWIHTKICVQTRWLNRMRKYNRSNEFNQSDIILFSFRWMFGVSYDSLSRRKFKKIKSYSESRQNKWMKNSNIVNNVLSFLPVYCNLEYCEGHPENSVFKLKVFFENIIQNEYSKWTN